MSMTRTTMFLLRTEGIIVGSNAQKTWALDLLKRVEFTGPPTELRAKIVAFERALADLALRLHLPHVELPLKHTFTKGAYVREITLPAEHLIVGKIHRHEHLNFISRGDVTVVTESGGVERLKGPCTLISPPGTKRVVYTHEETVWTTVHSTEETDLEKIEAEHIAPSYTALGLWDPVGYALSVGELDGEDSVLDAPPVELREGV